MVSVRTGIGIVESARRHRVEPTVPTGGGISDTNVQKALEYLDAALRQIVSTQFSTFAAMLADPTTGGLPGGRTLGYFTPFDGGGATYQFVASQPSHPAKGHLVTGYWAELAVNEVDPKMLGGIGAASGDTARNTLAINNAILYAQNKSVPVVLSQDYLVSGLIDMPSALVFNGNGRVLSKRANGDMLRLANFVVLKDLYLAGFGATYTGRGLIITDGASAYYQQVTNLQVYDMASYAVEFTEATAGHASTWTNCVFQRNDPTLFSVKLPDTEPTSSGLRKFINCRGQGAALYDFAGSCNTYIEGGDSFGMNWTDNTIAVDIVQHRFASATRTIKGAATNITDSKMNGTTHLGASALGCQVRGCVFQTNALILDLGARRNVIYVNDATFTDNSGQSNNIYELVASGAPSWFAIGTAPAIGNGSLACDIERRGTVLDITLRAVFGSTTTFGTSDYYFQLPGPYNAFAAHEAIGVAVGQTAGGGYRSGTVILAAGNNNIFIRDAVLGMLWGQLVPWTWASGDHFTLQMEIPLY